MSPFAATQCRETVLGSVVLNYPEGGLNPEAIRVAQSANKSPSMNRKPDDLPFVVWEEISGSF